MDPTKLASISIPNQNSVTLLEGTTIDQSINQKIFLTK